MSLEKAMEQYAVALEKNAEALNKHTEVMQRVLEQGVAFAVPADTVAAAQKPEPAKTEDKPKRGPKSKPEKEEKSAPKADDGDDFGDDDDFKEESSSESLSADDIRNLLMKVKDDKGADAARGILKELGVAAIAQIPEKDFEKTVKLAAKVGVKL